MTSINFRKEVRNFAFTVKLSLLFLFLIPFSIQSQNWETVPSLSGISSSETHTGLFFFNANIGWISRNDGAILKTTDGGTTWTIQATGTRVSDIYFISETHGWAGGGLFTYYTTDGGDNWTSVQAGTSVGSESILSIHFVSATHGWACGYNWAYKTIDGGLTWTKQIPNGVAGIYTEIYFLSETLGFVVGAGNKIYKSTDGGVTWVPQNSGTPYVKHTGIHFVDANTAFVSGEDGAIKKSIDGGANWTSVITQTSNSPDLNDIFFVDANNGWVVGNERTIKSTSDGGATWLDENTTSSDKFRSFRSVFFTDATTGFALPYDDLLTYSVALTPTISRFDKDTANSGVKTATSGDTVIVTGTNFTGTTNITLGGVTVSGYTVDSPTQITLTVGPGLSGDLAVTTFGGTATQAGFIYINQAPTLAAISDVSNCEALLMYSVPVSVSDIETSPANLIVTATSSNQAIVKNANIVVTGTTQSKILTITPETNAKGVITITVKVTDEANDTDQKTFDLTVGGDLEKPVVITQNISVSLDATGNATILPAEINLGSNDNCSSSPGSVSPLYLSGGSSNKLWSFVKGVDIAPQQIAVDWSIVGDYGGVVYFGNYGGLEVNELNGELFVAGGGYNKNFVMQAPIDGSTAMKKYVGESTASFTVDFEIESATQTVYTATTGGLYSEVIGSGTRTLLIAGDIKGVTLDTTTNTLYYATTTGINKIKTDGTGNVTNFITVDNPGLITLDVATGRLFWVEKTKNSIDTALTDGSGKSELYKNTTISGTIGVVEFVPNTNELFYSITAGSYYASDDYIFKVAADGTGVHEEVVRGDFGGVTGIATGKNYIAREELVLKLDKTTFTCTDIGQKTVTLTATDSSGNETSATAVVTVTDVNNVCSGLNIVETLIPFTSCFSSNSDEQNFVVSGDGLTDNVVINTPANFEVSLTSGSGFSNTLTISNSSSSLGATTIFIRTTTTASSGTSSGEIIVSSTGMTDKKIAVSATISTVPQPVSISNSICNANGLQWAGWTSVSATAATGTIFNNVGVSVTHTVGGMSTTPSMYNHTAFPSNYNVPNTKTIRNDKAGKFTINFTEPISNPQVAFSSIGNPGTPVGINTSEPYQVIWQGLAMNYTSSTSMTGNEGFTIISFPGTHSSIEFDYLADEVYCNMAFGAEEPACSNIKICKGESITLTAAGGSSYLWSPSTGLSATNTATVTAKPLVTTTYSVIDTSDPCAKPTQVVVTVENLPSNPVVEATQLICPGDTVADLQATVATGETIEWYASISGGSPLASTTVLVPGTMYYAQSANSNNCVSNRLSVQAVTNNAINFDGINDYVSITDSNLDNVTTDLTIESWVYINSNSNAEIFSKNVDLLGTKDVSYSLRYRDGKLMLHVGNGVDYYVVKSDDDLPLNQWIHVAGSFQTNVGGSLYLNGEVFNSSLNTGSLVSLTVGNHTNDVANIGRYPFSGDASSGRQYFNGNIDELRIWNVIKTQSDIKASMILELAGNETGLLAYYNFNQGVINGNNASVSSLNDLADTNTGTLSNLALNGASSNFVAGYTPKIEGPSNQFTFGETLQLTHPISGGVWSSGDSGKVTVDVNGLLKPVSLGTTSISYSYCGNMTSYSITVIEGVTEDPILTSPATNTTGATNLTVDYSLPETPLSGSVTLTFSPTDGGSDIVWVMTDLTAVNFSYLVGADPTTISNVVSGSALSFTTYDVTVSYQDVYSSPIASVTNTNVQTLAPPSITLSQTNYKGVINVAFTAITIQNTGGDVAVYSISPTLPSGVTIDASTGVISGTPIVSMSQTEYTVTATNAAGVDTDKFMLFVDIDTDGDGLGNDDDPDDDNDGTLDADDAFPLDDKEDTDTDGDGIGNNADPDDDDDGQTDADEISCGSDPLDKLDTALDTDLDSIPNCIDSDDDNDGTLDADDAFPLDDKEDTDSDGDGIGNNADPDDDNDGQTDADEISCGSDPLDKLDTSLDTDLDGIPDCVDPDDDNDGTLDVDDAFPLDDKEDTDTDGDGIGNNADPDDDDDGQTDADEVSCGSDPLDEFDTSLDTDQDGIPDCVDADDDDDGVSDTQDNCPLTYNPFQEDRDNDGLGDVCDLVEVNISEALSPNGDGVNDTWMIYNIENYPNNRVKVFNRWGAKVFEKKGYQNNWDGSHEGNSPVPLPESFSYYYQIDLDGDGVLDYQGWLYITQ